MLYPYKRAYTHGGVFHTDDVFAWAVLHHLFPDMKLTRGFSPPAGKSDTIVFDIGDGYFDHHSAPREVRKNGVPYAAFGKVVRHFKRELFRTEYDYNNFDKNFVQPLDEEDNNGPAGKGSNTLSLSVMAFNPQFGENQSEAAQNAAFFQAAQMAGQILTRQLAKFTAMAAADLAVKASLSEMKNHIVFLETYIPFGSKYCQTDCYFVVSPNQRGGYNAICVRGQNGNSKIPFPENWRGKSAGELNAYFNGLSFVHASGHLAAFQSKDHAVSCCEHILALSGVATA